MMNAKTVRIQKNDDTKKAQRKALLNAKVLKCTSALRQPVGGGKAWPPFTWVRANCN